MADERKYREEEVKEIFDLAASSDELMEPRRIAEAARALETRREVIPRRTYMGVPISVGRVIDLPRALTDHEWEVLVGELRETFGARGKVMSHAGVREWANGNLHAFLEPAETGHRLRLTTLKGGAMGLITVGVAGLVLGLILLTLLLTTGVSPVRLELFTMLLVGIGGGALASNVLSLPRWAREREGQMEYIAGRVRALVGEWSHGDESGI